MHLRTHLLVLALVAGSFVLPHLAHAAIPFFGPIVPNEINRCAAGWGAVIVVINNIMQFTLTVAIVFLMPIMIAYAGFLYVVNPIDPSGISKAKSILINTIAGIAIALAAWLIVDAVMAVLYKPPTGSSWDTWKSLIGSGGAPLCMIQESSLQNLNQTNLQITGITGEGGITTTEGSGQLRNGFALGCTTSNDQNATELASVGVSGSSTGNCCTKTQSTCTSLDGMFPSTIQQIKNVKNACGGIVVSGGTEVGHSGEGNTASHSGGAKVDISQNLISCITGTSGSSVVSNPTFGSAQVMDKCGNIYTWEGNHTDIYVQSICAL